MSPFKISCKFTSAFLAPYKVSFFFNLFNRTYLRPSVKSTLNLFYLTHSINLLYRYLVVPSLFLNTKCLSIRILKFNLGHYCAYTYKFIFIFFISYSIFLMIM